MTPEIHAMWLEHMEHRANLSAANTALRIAGEEHNRAVAELDIARRLLIAITSDDDPDFRAVCCKYAQARRRTEATFAVAQLAHDARERIHADSIAHSLKMAEAVLALAEEGE